MVWEEARKIEGPSIFLVPPPRAIIPGACPLNTFENQDNNNDNDNALFGDLYILCTSTLSKQFKIITQSAHQWNYNQC